MKGYQLSPLRAGLNKLLSQLKLCIIKLKNYKVLGAFNGKTR